MSKKKAAYGSSITRVLIVSLFIGLTAVITAAASWTGYIDPFGLFAALTQSTPQDSTQKAEPKPTPVRRRVIEMPDGRMIEDSDLPVSDEKGDPVKTSNEVPNSLAPLSSSYTFLTNATSSLALDINTNTVDMTTGTTTIHSTSVDDSSSAVITLPFDFFHAGNRYSQFSVTSNGLIALSNTSTTALNNSYVASGGTVTTPIISPFAADLGTGTSGKVHYKTVGTAPNRTLVIEFSTMTLLWTGSFTNDGTFQARLYESTGVIEFVYGAMSIISTASASDTTVGIGFSTNTTTDNLAYVTSSTNTASTTASFTDNTIYPTGAIANLNSASNGSRRTYRFTPPVPSPATGSLTFTGITPSSMTLNWGDAPSEVGYAIYRSTDGGTTYSYFNSAASDAVSLNATGLSPSTAYFWKVYAISEGALSTALTNSQATAAPGTISSTAAGGLWSATGTWVGGVVPTASDNVMIADGATVTQNTTAAVAYSVTVGSGAGSAAILTADGTTTARTLTVTTDVTINANGTVRSNTVSPASSTLHGLSIGGNMAINGAGTFNGSASTNSKLNITFTGSANATFTTSATGTVSFNTVTINKGTTSASILDFTPGANWTATAGSQGFTITNGTLKISGSATISNVVFNATGYTIPATGGIWLNNPNFTLAAQGASPTMSGLLRMTLGTYNVGTGSGNSMGGAATSIFLIEGGTMNFGSRLNVTSAGAQFMMSAGTVNMCTVASPCNTSSAIATFGFTSATSVFTMSGGNINLVNASTGATPLDWNVAGTANITGGTLNIGTAATVTNFNFRIQGQVPALVVNNTGTAKTATLSALTNVWGNLTINTGASLNHNATTGFTLQMIGSTVTNNGSIVGTAASARFDFLGLGAQTYSGSGTWGTAAAPFVGFGLGISNTNNVTLSSPIVTTRVNLFAGQFINSNQITIGSGLALGCFVQRGGGGTTAGSFDVAPLFNLGTGTYQVTYTTATNAVTTSVEIPSTRTLNLLTINNTNGVTLAGGNLSVSSTLTMTLGNLITSSSNLVTVTGTTTGSVSGGSATSYINGPFARTLPASLVSGSTYTFPVGKSAFKLFELVNPTTTAGGPVTLQAEVFDGDAGGTAGTGINTLFTNRYWLGQITAGSGNFTNTSVRLTDSPVGNRIGKSATQTGTYDSIGGTVVGSTILSNAITSFSYFVMGNVTLPTGTYTVGAGGNYTTLTAAAADYNSKPISGPVIFSLTDASYAGETFPITFNANTGASPTNTLTIKPASGISPTISGSSATCIMTFNGSSYVNVDGSNSVNGTTRDLTLANTNTSGATVCLQNAATNNSVKNSILKGVSTSTANGVVFFSTVASGTIGNSTNTIQNNDITRGATAPVYGVYNLGTSTAKNTSNQITGNRIFDFSTNGIRDDGNSSATTYTRNEILEVTTQSTPLVGFRPSSTSIDSFTFTRNYIHDLNTSSAGTVYGIHLFDTNSAASACLIANNMIALSATAPLTLRGIYDQTAIGEKYNIYANSVFIGGTVSGASNSAAYNWSIASTSDVRDNIFVNARTGGTGRHYAYQTNTTLANLTSDYNDIYNTGGTGNVFGNNGTADVVDLATWKLAPTTGTGKDANSKSADPQFKSAIDLHITRTAPGTLSPGVENFGTPIAASGNDYDSDTRDGTTPDIGADEVTTYQFSSGTYTVAENVGGGLITITVTRTASTGSAGTVAYATSNGTATGAASCGGAANYVNTSGTLNFAAADTSRTFNVPVCANGIVEADTTVNLTLSGPIGSILGSPDTSVLTITNTDVQTYTLTYSGNGNTGGTAPVDGSNPYVGGATVTVLGNTGSLVKTGYTFAGWNTLADGTGTNYSPGNTFLMPAANTTLFAKWTINNYNVSYDANGGTGTAPATQNAAFGSSVTLAANTFTRAGYTFSGWDTITSGSGANHPAGSSFMIPANDTTMYAQWTASTPIITAIGGPLSFANTPVGAISAEQSYTVEGTDLTANLAVTSPSSDFEVSTTPGSGFGSSVSLTPVSGTVATTTIHVRFTPGSTGLKGGDITNASAGATTQNVAVSGTGTAGGYYRSKQSGNWADASTWEVSADGVSGWVDTTITPTAANSSGITITSSHTVTVASNTDADQATVASGGTLVVTAMLTVADGTGTDLTNSGSVTVNGTFALAGTVSGTAFSYGGSSTLVYAGTTAQTSTSVEYPLIGSTPTSLTIDNAGGVTLHANRSVAGIFTLTNGVLTTDATKILTVTNTAAGAVVGGSATSYVSGPMRRVLPDSLTGSSVYAFPVGKGGYNALELVDPHTTAALTPTMQVEVFDVHPGGPGTAGIENLRDGYWSAEVPVGGFVDTQVRLTDTSLTDGVDQVGFNGDLTPAGNYLAKGGTVVGDTIESTTATPPPGFYAIGGPGPVISADPFPLDFGNQVVFTASTQQNLTVTNSGSTNLSISGAVLTGANSGDFAVTSDPGAVVLAPGNSTTYGITFTPSALSTRNAALRISSNAENGATYDAELTGNGIPVPTYTITASSGANGTVTPAGVTTINSGDSQAYTITPDAGYHIVDVLVDTVSQGPIGSFTFTNVTVNHTISATFAINTYTITATAGANGSISPSGAVSVNSGDNATFTITPNAGYHILDVLVDGVSIGAAAGHTFSNVTANHTIDATFAINTYTITASSGANGTVTPAGVTTINSGDSQAYTITPDAGYHIVDVLVDTVSQGPIGGYTFSNVTANHTISATFAINTYTITATAGANGSISPSGAVSVNSGDNATFTITPNAGYHVDVLTVDGGSVPAATSYTFTNVTAAHTINVTFALNTYTITATAGANGSISPSGAVSVDHGANQSFTITPNAGYHVDILTVDGGPIPAATSYTFTNVTATHTIDVTFAVNPTPIITFDAAPTPTYLGGNFTVNATTTNTDSPALTYSVVSGPCVPAGGATFSSTGAGTCQVQASGAATANYTAATATQNVIIAKANQATVTLSGVPGTATYGDTFTAVGGGGSGTGAFSYAVTGTACTVHPSTGAGSVVAVSGGCSVTATRAGDNDYNPAASAASVIATINPAEQATLTAVATPSTVIYGNTSALSSTGGSGTGAVTFSSGLSMGCSVAGTTLSVTDVSQTCAVTATRAADANYNQATSAPLTVTLQKADQATLTVDDPGTVTYGSTPQLTTSGGSGTGAVTFSHGGSMGCSVTGGGVLTVTDVSAACNVTATRATDNNYNPTTSAQRTITLAKANQATLTAVATPPSVTYGSTSALSSTGGSGTGAVTFSHGASTGCSVTGTALSVTNASGTCEVTATRAADNNYNAATSAPLTVTLVKATPTVTFGAAPTPAYLGGNFTVSASTTNTDSSTLTYSVVSGPCALVSGATFSSSGAGACVVQASGVATSNFTTASATQSVTIAKATPTVIFGAAPTPAYPGANFTVSASTTNTDSSTLIYSKVSGPCTFVSGATFSSTGAGTCIVRADGAASTNFNAAFDTQNVTIAAVQYTITATAGSNGSITPGGAVLVTSGANQAFTISADAGYHIADVLVDSVSQGTTGSYTFTNVTANHTISATFAINTYTIGASAGANGSISPSGSVVVNHGANQSFTITPDGGYNVANVLVDGISVGAVTSHTFTNVTANHTITATFFSGTQALIVYVDDDWAGTTPGTDPDGAGPASSFGYDAFATIQDGVAGVGVNGTVIVNPGSYSGDVNVNRVMNVKGVFTISGALTVTAAGASVSPGFSPGIINSGNLSLTAGSNVNIEVNGPIVGTQYDQLNVTGTVSLGNANLNVGVSNLYTPSAGQTFTIVNNDGNDPVTGTFAGLAENDVFYSGTTSFRISYAGGSNNNDVVLTTVALCNSVSIPNYTTLNASPVTASVNVNDTTGKALQSTDFTITYNPAVVTFGSASLGTVTAGGVLNMNSSTPGTLVVSIFKATPFSGAGSMLDITFNTVGQPGTSTPLAFSAFKFNEGTQCISTANGSVSVISGTITGIVTYGNSLPAATRHVPNTTIDAAGSVNASVLTNLAGAYSISSLGAGSYTVTPSKSGEVNGAVTGMDAAQIAQWVVGTTTLNATQQTVADVSGTGGISSFDAALIARYVVSLPNAGSSGTWRFTPAGTTYPNVNVNRTGDYTALLMGDVSGNWIDPLATRPAPDTEELKPVVIGAPELSALVNTEVVVPVEISDTTNKGIMAYQFELRYDPAVLEPAADPADLVDTISSGYQVTVNAAERGLLRVVVFGTQPLNGGGRLINLRFKAIGNPGSASDLIWENLALNEGGFDIRSTNGRVLVTAAPSNNASLGGRVMTAEGQPVRNARVTLIDTTGQSRYVMTGSLGYYQFTGLQLGETYTVRTSAKRHRFQVITVSMSGEAVSLDIIAQPGS